MTSTSSLEDRFEIIDICTQMMWYIDIRDWKNFADVFASKVILDYTGLWGGEPEQVTPEEVTANWSALFDAFDATQHLLGNHLVTVKGDEGTLTAVFQATHRVANPFGSPLWTLGGTYQVGVIRIESAWKINHVVMTPTWGEGNKEVVTLAITAGQK
jgi:hypothetical protein